MKFFKPLFVLLVHPVSLFFISVLLFLFNWLIFKNKYEGWLATDLRTYRGLYYGNDRSFISDIERSEVDSIVEITVKPTEKKIKINLKYGFHNYKIPDEQDSLQNIHLRVSLTPLDIYTKMGNSEHS
ncbi:MAG: hypothetical protein KA313_08270, partial [Pseudarcicella sp.]|nr:hypothetical protein [Pseudarcicella sp.]